MNKQDLVEAVAQKLGTSKAGGGRAVKAVLEGIKNGVKKEKSLFDRHLFRASAYQTVAQIKTTHRLKALIQWSCRVIIFLLIR